MSVQENKAIIRRYWTYDPEHEIVDELLADDFVNHNPTPGFGNDKEGFIRLLGAYYEGLPNHNVTINELVAQGDKVVTRWTIRGAHQGELMGVPATGKEVEITGTTINRLRDGQIVEQWQCEDTVGLMQQLGVIPAPDGAPA